MNRNKLCAIVYLVIILFAVVLIVDYYTGTRDVSWINEVENFIQKGDWIPNSEFEPIQDWAFFLDEDGTEQYFFLECQVEFISCINSVMNGINRRIEESIPEDLLSEIWLTTRSWSFS